mmetsp:Transcript_38526/g.83458  ORF Transcript_38526/g.83458 Transcript_38526/m.83458 type:complete len:225 (+) Transcript_38526:181-855(+)
MHVSSMNLRSLASAGSFTVNRRKDAWSSFMPHSAVCRIETTALCWQSRLAYSAMETVPLSMAPFFSGTRSLCFRTGCFVVKAVSPTIEYGAGVLSASRSSSTRGCARRASCQEPGALMFAKMMAPSAANTKRELQQHLCSHLPQRSGRELQTELTRSSMRFGPLGPDDAGPPGSVRRRRRIRSSSWADEPGPLRRRTSFPRVLARKSVSVCPFGARAAESVASA